MVECVAPVIVALYLPSHLVAPERGQLECLDNNEENLHIWTWRRDGSCLRYVIFRSEHPRSSTRFLTRQWTEFPRNPMPGGWPYDDEVSRISEKGPDKVNPVNLLFSNSEDIRSWLLQPWEGLDKDNPTDLYSSGWDTDAEDIDALCFQFGLVEKSLPEMFTLSNADSTAHNFERWSPTKGPDRDNGVEIGHEFFRRSPGKILNLRLPVF